jgi:hypothetical protein
MNPTFVSRRGGTPLNISETNLNYSTILSDNGKVTMGISSLPVCEIHAICDKTL